MNPSDVPSVKSVESQVTKKYEGYRVQGVYICRHSLLVELYELCLKADAVPAHELATAASSAAWDLLQTADRFVTELESALKEQDHAMTERDKAEEVADKLADKIATMESIDIGEHSSANDPWQNALDGVSQEPE